MFKYTVMSECTALLSQKSGFRGVFRQRFSSCAAPTYYCRSKYFYSQCPQVQKAIGMEISEYGSEHSKVMSTGTGAGTKL